MNAKYFLFLVKLKGKGRPFMEGKSIDLKSKLSLTYRDNVKPLYKSVHHLLSTLPVGTGNNLTAFKTNN